MEKIDLIKYEGDNSTFVWKHPTLERISATCNDPHRTYIGEADSYKETGIPIFEVTDVFALTKLIGHAKYLNSGYGEVVYRGQNQLVFGDVKEGERSQGQKPSAYRGNINKKEVDAHVEEQLQKLLSDSPNDKQTTLESFVHFQQEHQASAKYAWEALLQHYEAKTRFLDVVDNHWIALWFACYTFNAKTRHYRRSQRKYSYIIVYALPTNGNRNIKGILINENCVVVDLRQACPSTVLRPHMQHAKLFALLDDKREFKEDYACNIVCIIQIRTDLCFDWLGNTPLVHEHSLFPCRHYDHMLNLIEVERRDIFDDIMANK